MQTLTWVLTGRVAGRGGSVPEACLDIFREEGPFHEFQLVGANGVHPSHPAHDGPVQDVKVIRRGGDIMRLKYKKVLTVQNGECVFNVTPGFRFMTPHKHSIARRARRRWRVRKAQKPEHRVWYREYGGFAKAAELRSLSLAGLCVPEHMGEIVHCSDCYDFTTVLGAHIRN